MKRTKSCRNLHEPYTTVTLSLGSTVDGAAGCLRFQVNRTVKKTIQLFYHRTSTQTVRCGFAVITTVRFGAVFRKRNTYGAVRCGFQMS